MKNWIAAWISAALLVAVNTTSIGGIMVNYSTFFEVGSGQNQVLTDEMTREDSLARLAERQQIRLEGGWEWNEGASQEVLAGSRYNDVVVEGSFRGSWLEIYGQLAGQQFEVELDQLAPIRLTAPKTNRFDYFRVLDGLAVRSTHHFRLRLANHCGAGLKVRSLRTNGHWITENYAHRPRLIGYGSSTIEGTGITWELGRARGWEVINRGIGGATAIRQGQSLVARDVLPYEPDAVLVYYGSNDWFDNAPLPEFRAAYLNMLNQLASGLPKAHFVVMGLFPRKGGNETTRLEFNQAIQESFQNSLAAGRGRYFEVKGYNWATDTGDGTHPTLSTVQNKFVPQLLPLLQY